MKIQEAIIYFHQPDAGPNEFPYLRLRAEVDEEGKANFNAVMLELSGAFEDLMQLLGTLHADQVGVMDNNGEFTHEVSTMYEVKPQEAGNKS